MLGICISKVRYTISYNFGPTLQHFGTMQNHLDVWKNIGSPYKNQTGNTIKTLRWQSEYTSMEFDLLIASFEIFR